MPVSRLVQSLLTVFALGVPAAAAAVPAAQDTAPREAVVVPQVRVSLDQAVAIARREVPGRVLGAESRYRRGRVTHEIKILTDDGAVHVVRVDGATGRASH